MSDIIYCFRCGESLEKLSLPLSRRDECPACTADLHICRMCVYFDPNVPRQCTEDGAEEVLDKLKVNFCDWFKPSSTAFDPAMAARESQAKNQLDSLFGGEAATEPEPDDASRSAEDLFK